MLSGAVMNPKALRELVPDFEQQGFPTEYVCSYAGFWIFHPKGKLNVPIVPPNFRKKGYHVVSLSNVAKWLAERAEAAGVDDLPRLRGRPAADRGRARGRRAHRRHGHRSRRASRRRTISPGMDIFAKVTVIGEGVRGTLAKQLIDRFELAGPQSAHLRDGRQGDLADRSEEARPGPRRPRHAVPRDPEPLPRHVALRHEGQPDLLRLRDAARLREPALRPAPGGAEVQDDAVDALAARGRGAGALRREGDPDRRALRAAQALHRRRAAGRRLGGLLQRAEPRRDPHGDEVRDARRRDAGRGARASRTSPPRRSAPTRSATGAAGPGRSTTRPGTSARSIERGTAFFGPQRADPDADRRPRPARPAADRGRAHCA